MTLCAMCFKNAQSTDIDFTVKYKLVAQSVKMKDYQDIAAALGLENL